MGSVRGGEENSTKTFMHYEDPGSGQLCYDYDTFAVLLVALHTVAAEYTRNTGTW